MASSITLAMSLLLEYDSCWKDADSYDVSLSYNMLTLKADNTDSGCFYDTPIITATALTFLHQSVQLRLMTPPNPIESAVYFHFFDPGDETFAGEVDFVFAV